MELFVCRWTEIVRNRKIQSDLTDDAQVLPQGRRGYLLVHQAANAASVSCEPAAFYVRACDHFDVVTDDPDGHLQALPDEPFAPKVVAVYLLDCPKDGLDYAMLVVLGHEPV